MPNRRDLGAPGRGGDAGRVDAAGRGEAPTVHRLPDGLADLPWELPRVFLGLDGPGAAPEGAGTWILPVPYQATTSWGAGTRRGPWGIIDASRYIELFDHELDSDPSTAGIYTFPALELSRGDAERATAELEEAYGRILDAAEGRRVLMIGGEHSISSPAILAHVRRSSGPVTVLQLDAHLDLRSEFDGSPYSHACAMARVVDHVDLVSVGARGISEEEWGVARERDNVVVIVGEDLHGGDGWMERALDALGRTVYVTFDVDFLDPALMPATGTPEPGGLGWQPTVAFLRRVFQSRTVIGVDVVEHAPIPGHDAPDFVVAKLVYKIIGYWSRFGDEP